MKVPTGVSRWIFSAIFCHEYLGGEPDFDHLVWPDVGHLIATSLPPLSEWDIDVNKQSCLVLEMISP